MNAVPQQRGVDKYRWRIDKQYGDKEKQPVEPPPSQEYAIKNMKDSR